MARVANRRTTLIPVSATDAKNNFGAILVQAQSEPVVVESRGNATAVIVSVDEFDELERARDLIERQKTIERLRKIRAEAERRNSDLTPDEAEALVKEIVDETFARMLAEGKIRYDE